LRDIFSDGFRRAFHGFGRHLQTRQQLEVSASVLKGSLRTNQRQHAAHPWRQVCLGNVQSGIGRALSVMTLRT
jgi:hypothetical protein